MPYIPNQGDIVIMDFDPQADLKQKGRRPALVVSNNKYNQHCKMVLVCPITNTDKNHPFHIKLHDTQTTGVVLCDQIKALDLIARSVRYKESVPDNILEEAVDLVCSFVE